jgi:ComF family protein
VRTIRAFLNLFWPLRCAGCSADLPFDQPLRFCLWCLGQIEWVSGLTCARCGAMLPDGGRHCAACLRKKPAFALARSAAVFEGPLREALHAFKYSKRDHLSEDLGTLLFHGWKQYPELHAAQGLIPVPLHFSDRRERGFNQSELLARRLSRLAGNRPVLPRALRRVRKTRSQTRLSRNERALNVKNAFQGSSGSLKGKTLLLVDDVCTTGATLDACARALKAAGARKVLALTLARD